MPNVDIRAMRSLREVLVCVLVVLAAAPVAALPLLSPHAFASRPNAFGKINFQVCLPNDERGREGERLMRKQKMARSR